jgi:hypothetical protein
MRLHDTPSEWRPAGRVLRHRSFGTGGLPVMSSVFALIFLAGGAFAAWQVIRRFFSTYSTVEVPVLAIAVVLVGVGLVLAYVAADRMLRGYDTAVEIDPGRRSLLVLGPQAAVRGNVLVLPFAGIAAIGVTQSVTRYTSGRVVLHASVVALPSGVTLLSERGENEVSRGWAEGRARSVAAEIAAALGVPADLRPRTAGAGQR